jgi:hypothetical protein
MTICSRTAAKMLDRPVPLRSENCEQVSEQDHRIVG